MQGDAVAEFARARGRVVAIATVAALSLASAAGGSARAQTGGDNAAGSLNLGARAGLAADAPPRAAPPQDGAPSPFEFDAGFNPTGTGSGMFDAGPDADPTLGGPCVDDGRNDTSAPAARLLRPACCVCVKIPPT